MVRIRAWRQSFIFYFFLCFFYLDLFSSFFSSLTASTIRQLLHLGIKSQKAVHILYCLQKFSLFLSSHSSCLQNRSIFDPTNEIFIQRNFYRVNIKFLIICFLTCPKLLHLSHTKQTAEMSIAIQACTICMFGNRTV